MTFFMPEAKLALVGPCAAHDAFVDLTSAGFVVGMEQALPGADVWLDLVIGVPEHLLPSRRVHHVACLQVPIPYAFLRTGEGQAEPFFAFMQRGFGPPALCDVEMRADDAHHWSGFVPADWKSAREHVDIVTIFVPEAKFSLIRALTALRALVHLLGEQRVVGM